MEEEIYGEEEIIIENVDNNTTNSDNFERAGQIQNEMGSQVLQSLGVKNKRLADKAVKSNGGRFSPFNTPVDRKLKKTGQGMIANGLDRNNRGISYNKSNGKYNPFDKIKQNRFSQFNSYRNRNNNGQTNEENKNVIEKAATQTIEKGGSTAMQSAGIPKPVADAISKKITGPALEKYKKSLKIKIAIAFIPAVLIFLVVFALLGGETAANDEAKQIAKSAEMTSYLYGDGTEEQLYKKLIDMGLCETNAECATTEAATFYINLKSKITGYDDTTKKIAANFIIEMTRYNRYDRATNGRKSRYDTVNEIEYLGNIILVDGSLTTESIKSYKNKIIEDGGYFEIYRPELLKKDKDNTELKSKIFDKVINLTIDIVGGVISPNLANGGSCIYQVDGTQVSNIKIQLTECADLNKPIDGGELIDLEKYILGVVYQENGNAPSEALKVQAIAARSYTLTRRKIEFIDGQAVIKMRNCTYDQVYCDPDKGCSSNVIGGQTTKNANNSLATVYSGIDASKKWSRQPLAANSDLRSVVNEVAGMVAVNQNGDVLYTGYVSSDQIAWNSMATFQDDYVSILKKHYKNKKDYNYDLTVTSKCSNIYATGDFTSWKQCKESWSDIKLGTSNSTICNAGCLVTSVAIQLAKSGVTTNLSTLDPGTFVQALSQNGGFSGAEFTWNPVSSIAPNFILGERDYQLTGTKVEKANQLKSLLDSGYYVVIRVSITNQHWVALDRVEGENVYIHDPGGSATSLWDTYSADEVTRCGYYKVVQ